MVAAERSGRGWRLRVPLSIVLFLALTAAGTYWVRKGLLERAMAQALETGDEGMIRSLIDWWPCPTGARDANGRTPLHWAALADDIEAVRVLLRKGADPNARTPQGYTPLFEAVGINHREVAEALIASGADVNAKTNASVNGETPLLAAISFEAARLLVAHGADVKAAATNGDTPLHRAARFGDIPTIELLVSRGADVNAIDGDGRAPLHAAADHGCLDVLELLIGKGAKVDVADTRGETPLDTARKLRARWQEAKAATHSSGSITEERRTESEKYCDDMILRCDEAIRLLLRHGANPQEPPRGTHETT